ncbi:OLC1v1024689C2 [Oldenlandia corymbosa var. corymbosa]|uniref:OLC1v1024689C2 n=1 Tax=Oldenlandia corymbosa var. corymbosa TaxID=529605 RepID=A0AAV1C605_OLDCO|nr:OLC1v1024689C2 [Oldenlandia corymbosa var. corymbosa]
MLSRFIAKSSHLRFLTLISSSQNHLQNLKPTPPPPLIPNPNIVFQSQISHFYSTGNNNNNNNNNKDSPTSHLWNLSSEADDSVDSVFGDEELRTLDGLSDEEEKPQPPHMKSESQTQKWSSESLNDGAGGEEDIFREAEKGHHHDGWATAEGYKPWTLTGDGGDKDEVKNLFDVGKGDKWEMENEVSEEVDLVAFQNSEEGKFLEVAEKKLTEMLKGPNRAFGDLIAASGITDEMLDSLMALKNFEDIPGLPPLWKIEDNRYEKSTMKSSRAEIERQKQEELANSRVRRVDDKGRAYGTGRRKCSIARVWVQPGAGKFVVNDKEFDVYFPMLDHRAILLRPFSETKTLGLWDVNCTVKGGGVSGQVGAIRLGISRALQNWAPDLRPPLRAAGFLTRDPRVVERKKPGKAKARRSFQWVKR